MKSMSKVREKGEGSCDPISILHTWKNSVPLRSSKNNSSLIRGQRISISSFIWIELSKLNYDNMTRYECFYSGRNIYVSTIFTSVVFIYLGFGILKGKMCKKMRLCISKIQFHRVNYFMKSFSTIFVLNFFY